MSSDANFDLSDLEPFLVVKKEKPTPSTIQPQALPSRSSSKGKKRKVAESVDVDTPDESNPSDLLCKLQQSINKLSSERDVFEKDAAEFADQKKDLEGKVKHLEKEVAKLKKQMKDSETAAKVFQDETVKKAMKSASIAILKAKIEMAKKATANGIKLWAKELKDWQETLSELTGVIEEVEDIEEGTAEDDAKGDKEGADAGKKILTDGDEVGPNEKAGTGDEGNIAQT